MHGERVGRRLVAILAADVIAEHHGRIPGLDLARPGDPTTGDGMLSRLRLAAGEQTESKQP